MAEINLAEVLNNVVSQRASDLHIQVGRPPIIRVGGNLIQLLDYGALSDEAMENIIYGVLDDTQKQTLNQSRELDFSFEFGQMGRFRVNGLLRKRPPVSINASDYQRHSVNWWAWSA